MSAILALVIGTILAVLSIVVIIYPFWPGRGRPPEETALKAGEREAGETEGPDLESIYEAIHTLQLERQLGNIPEGLFREQLRDYRWQAAVILRDRAEARDADWRLEEEIRLARAGLTRATDSGTDYGINAGVDSNSDSGGDRP